MNKKLHTEAVDSLFDAILSLETREECYALVMYVQLTKYCHYHSDTRSPEC